MNKDILICGVGGQGTVLASKIIAASASAEGDSIHSAETIGMAQRGGSVTSHVRIGKDAYSPLIPYGNADLLLAFEPAEAVRNLKYLRSVDYTFFDTIVEAKQHSFLLHQIRFPNNNLVPTLNQQPQSTHQYSNSSQV